MIHRYRHAYHRGETDDTYVYAGSECATRGCRDHRGRVRLPLVAEHNHETGQMFTRRSSRVIPTPRGYGGGDDVSVVSTAKTHAPAPRQARGNLFSNMSDESIDRLTAALLAPETTLTGGTQRLAEHVMYEGGVIPALP